MEAQVHTPAPHPAARPAKPAPKAAMARPRSPFTYKQWNSDMYRRWQPVASAEASPESPADPPAASSDNPTGQSARRQTNPSNTVPGATAASPAAGQPASGSVQVANATLPNAGQDGLPGTPSDPQAAVPATPPAVTGQPAQPYNRPSPMLLALRARETIFLSRLSAIRQRAKPVSLTLRRLRRETKELLRLPQVKRVSPANPWLIRPVVRNSLLFRESPRPRKADSRERLRGRTEHRQRMRMGKLRHPAV